MYGIVTDIGPHRHYYIKTSTLYIPRLLPRYAAYCTCDKS